jgi:hypothetical protein
VNFNERRLLLDDAIARNAVAQFGWWDTPENTHSLIATICPEALAARTVAAVPADVMPYWLAHALMFLSEELAFDYWPEFLRRFRDAFALFPRLDATKWEVVEIKLRKALRERFRDNEPMIYTLTHGVLADAIYALPLHDGSDRFVAECLLKFIHEAANA